MKTFMQEKAILGILEGMAQSLQTDFSEKKQPPLMIGIHTGGVWLAEHLHKMMALPDALGLLDASLYRDDLQRSGINTNAKPTHLPFNIDDRDLILVDDVLQTGRTIRAAINGLFDYGRPASIKLLELVVRKGREIPIQADYIGFNPSLRKQDRIVLNGPNPLVLTLVTNDQPKRENQ